MSSRPPTSACPISPSNPIHWILDWDGTITKKDTLDALVNIAASTEPSFPTVDLWKLVSEAYVDDYTTTLDGLAPNGKLPSTVEEEKKLLRDLRDVEQRSLDRVSQSGIFASLTKEQLADGAKSAIERKEVQLRDGYANFFQHFQSRESTYGDELNLISVNWSRHFISSCLKAAGIRHDPGRTMANELEFGDIYNEEEADANTYNDSWQGFNEDGPANGRIIGQGGEMVLSSGDKKRWFDLSRSSHVRAMKPVSVVYVGDSWTDIECLLAADLGICIRDEPLGSSQRKLVDALERLGVKCPHLGDWKNADGWNVVWAKDFHEIKKWLESGWS